VHRQSSVENYAHTIAVILGGFAIVVAIAWVDATAPHWISSSIRALVWLTWGAFVVRELSTTGSSWQRLHAAVATVVTVLVYLIPRHPSASPLDMPWVSSWERFISMAAAAAPPVVATTAGAGFLLHYLLRDELQDKRFVDVAIYACMAVALAFLLIRYTQWS